MFEDEKQENPYETALRRDCGADWASDMLEYFPFFDTKNHSYPISQGESTGAAIGEGPGVEEAAQGRDAPPPSFLLNPDLRCRNPVSRLLEVSH